MRIPKTSLAQFRMFTKAILGRMRAHGPEITLCSSASHSELTMSKAGYSIIHRIDQQSPGARDFCVVIPWTLFDQIVSDGCDLETHPPQLTATGLKVRLARHIGAIQRGIELDCQEPGLGIRRTTLDTPVLSRFCENLSNASECTDESSVRYALSCIQFDTAPYSICSTDGRQAFVFSDYQIGGLSCKTLIRSSPLFRRQDFRKLGGVRASFVGSNLVIANELWEFKLPVQTEGRFPNMQSVIPDVLRASNRVNLTRVYLSTLITLLRDLPGKNEEHRPVQLFLDRGVEIVGVDSGNLSESVKVVLADATHIGAKRSIQFDREFLMRALRCGFDRIYLFEGESPVVAANAHGKLVWMPLSNGKALETSAVRNCLALSGTNVCTESALACTV